MVTLSWQIPRWVRAHFCCGVCNSAYLHRRYARFDGNFAQPSFDVPFLGRNLILQNVTHFTGCVRVNISTWQHQSFGRKFENPHESEQYLIHAKTQHSTQRCEKTFRPLFVYSLHQHLTIPAFILQHDLFFPASYIIIPNLNWPRRPSPRIPNNHRYPSRFACTNCITTLSSLMRKTHASSITRRLSFHYRPSRNSKLHALLRHFWAALSLLWV